MLHLEALALLGMEGLVVGYFRHERGYVFAEAARDLIPIRCLDLDRVMEKSRNNEVRSSRLSLLRRVRLPPGDD